MWVGRTCFSRVLFSQRPFPTSKRSPRGWPTQSYLSLGADTRTQHWETGDRIRTKQTESTYPNVGPILRGPLLWDIYIHGEIHVVHSLSAAHRSATCPLPAVCPFLPAKIPPLARVREVSLRTTDATSYGGWCTDVSFCGGECENIWIADIVLLDEVGTYQLRTTYKAATFEHDKINLLGPNFK